MEKIAKISLVLIIFTGITGNLPALYPKAQEISPEELPSEFLTIEENSLLPVSPLPEAKVVKQIKVVVTAYSSTLWETDGDPFVTAAGTRVREGIIANNLLPFGTKIRLPELYGERIFVVEDRMSWKKGNYHFDIWFSSYGEALNFGAKRTFIEVLEG